jgi:hypothetical protein
MPKNKRIHPDPDPQHWNIQNVLHSLGPVLFGLLILRLGASLSLTGRNMENLQKTADSCKNAGVQFLDGLVFAKDRYHELS